MDLPLAKIEEALRERLRSRLKPRSYRDFDRRIGKGGSGWTSKFLRGERGLTLEALLVVVADLDIHPADLLEAAFPRPSAEAATEEYMEEFEQRMREIALRVYREMEDRPRS